MDMSSPSDKYYAVVTGDIVGSTRLSPATFKRVLAVIDRGGADLQKQFARSVHLPISVFRGDSWQLLVVDPGDALRVALYFRACLRAESDSGGIDTRFSIGVGPIDTLPERSVAEGRGEAFVLSGQLMDKKISSRMRFALARTTPDDWWEERSIAVILSIMDTVATRWTSAQARAVCSALIGWTQERIAKGWSDGPITQQAVAQHLARAGWDGISEAIEYYERVMRKWTP